MHNRGSVLVFVEQGPDRTVQSVSLECLTLGRKLAEFIGCRLFALVMGDSVEEATEEISRYDLDAVVRVEHPLLEAYQPELFVSAFKQVYEKTEPRAVLMGDTLTSVDLAPRLAFSLDTGLVTDCVGVESVQGEVRFIKPVYSGNVMAAYAFATEPYMATLRSRAEGAPKKSNAACEIITVDVEPDASAVEIEVIRRVQEEQEGPGLTRADRIVSGGRGMGGSEGFGQLYELAGILGAAVGASRPPCDLGWTTPKAQVGQTGEKVGPSLYIAVGISGTTQHVAGMYGSKKIVAINRDPKANIFNIADYGVVGNHEEVLPAFQEALSEIMK